ncbi:MAG: hypothetical protein FJY55_10260 [Betaproteobacteria bacterium]|nr:hypothetical protein [Betaproteobacteria bacterium]
MHRPPCCRYACAPHARASRPPPAPAARQQWRASSRPADRSCPPARGRSARPRCGDPPRRR